MLLLVTLEILFSVLRWDILLLNITSTFVEDDSVSLSLAFTFHLHAKLVEVVKLVRAKAALVRWSFFLLDTVAGRLLLCFTMTVRLITRGLQIFDSARSPLTEHVLPFRNVRGGTRAGNLSREL